MHNVEKSPARFQRYFPAYQSGTISFIGTRFGGHVRGGEGTSETRSAPFAHMVSSKGDNTARNSVYLVENDGLSLLQ